MGCASSKQKRCRHCNAPYSPAPRSYSVHVHHPPQSEDDSYHVVGLTSTTLGSLKLDLSHKAFEKDDQNGGLKFTIGNLLEKEKKSEALDGEIKTKEFSKGLIDAKTWSSMIDQKIPKVIPKTPTATPTGEPETINTWELMEGLEDAIPFPSPNHFRSFSLDAHSHPIPAPSDQWKPMWLRLQMTENDSTLKSTISDDDPQVVSSSSKSLQQLSPDSPLHLRTVYNEKQQGMPRKGFSFDATGDKMFNYDFKPFPWRQDNVILYFTSLRGIRKTYEDCCHVRMILKGLGVRVDERDVSLHSGFKEELIELLGDGFNWGGLPRVFVGKNYIGGVEEIQKLHEDGQLQKLIESCEKVDDGGEVCEGCGDIRFVPCETCFGSCKLYYEGHEEEEDDGQVGEYGFQRCPDCNENGLIRCPICC